MSIETQALETVYDHLADTLDAVPEPQQLLFLTRLAMLMSNEIADADRIRGLIDEAARSESW